MRSDQERQKGCAKLESVALSGYMAIDLGGRAGDPSARRVLEVLTKLRRRLDGIRKRHLGAGL
jgi:hypothetical protein